MSGSGDALKSAQDAARDARTQLSDTFCEIKARLQPSAIAAEAQEMIRDEAIAIGDKVVTFANERPGLVSAASTATVLVLLHRPLGRLLGRLLHRDGRVNRVIPGRGTGTI